MAKGKRVPVKLKSTADTGHFYVTFGMQARKAGTKLKLKKYDPKARKHVLYEEGKIK